MKARLTSRSFFARLLGARRSLLRAAKRQWPTLCLCLARKTSASRAGGKERFLTPLMLSRRLPKKSSPNGASNDASPSGHPCFGVVARSKGESFTQSYGDHRRFRNGCVRFCRLWLGTSDQDANWQIQVSRPRASPSETDSQKNLHRVPYFDAPHSARSH